MPLLVGEDTQGHWNESTSLGVGTLAHFFKSFCPSPRLFPGWEQEFTLTDA